MIKGDIIRLPKGTKYRAITKDEIHKTRRTLKCKVSNKSKRTLEGKYNEDFKEPRCVWLYPFDRKNAILVRIKDLKTDFQREVESSYTV